jgi:hypothetical protein
LIREWYSQNQFAFIEFKDNVSWKRYAVAGISFFIIGASLWVTELVFPQRYPLTSRDVLEKKLVSSPGFKMDAACFKKVIDENELKIAQGRALYPRYYWAGEGETFTDAAGYKKTDHNRIVFEMIGQMNNRVVFPITEVTDFFPNAADVTLGVDRDNKPWFVLVEQGNKSRFYLSDIFTGCP